MCERLCVRERLCGVCMRAKHAIDQLVRVDLHVHVLPVSSHEVHACLSIVVRGTYRAVLPFEGRFVERHPFRLS